MDRIVFVTVFSLVIAACAPSVTPISSYEVGSSVELNKRATARVGEIIFSEYEYVARRSARLQTDVEHTFGLPSTNVPAGTPLYGLKVGGKLTFCTAYNAVNDPIVGPWRQACFRDTQGDGKFDRIIVGGVWGDGDEISPAKYKPYTASANAGGFKYELIFQGLENNVMKVLYREYEDNLARSAFTQELSYTISQNGSNEISFRSVEILVHDVNNNSLSYTVLSGFDK